ncbi:N-glycosylase/DNA lyase [Candidatus Micrarchaeota archaeon]|jgi:N-glycosylase/DNA lyase|nr:N-glycosylase/DNA lyase [Candidatus Micrarchaeota archaeon]
MRKLVEKIDLLKRGKTAETVKSRLESFKSLGEKNKEEIFKELCFCTLTANYSAEGGIRIQKQVNEGFVCLPQAELSERFKELGYRFPNIRSQYICANRNKIDELYSNLKKLNDKEMREWIVENIKGIGYKEASHFLRNIGYLDYAIIDFHIVDILVKNKMIEKPKNLNKKKYLEIEDVLRKLAKATGLNLAELDLYLWYMETGKILK